MAAAELSRSFAKCSSGFTVEIESESDKRTGGRTCFVEVSHIWIFLLTVLLPIGIGSQLLRRKRFFSLGERCG
jgi:hypothetical protein